MRRKKILVSAIAFMLCRCGEAQAQQPEVPDVIKQFWSKVAKAKSMTFMVQYWNWESNTELVRKPYMRPLSTYEVSVQKPNQLAIHGTPYLEYETMNDQSGIPAYGFVGIMDNIQISDGKRSLVLSTLQRIYEYEPPIKSLLQANSSLALLLRFSDLFDTVSVQDFIPISNLHVPSREKRYLFDGSTGELVSLSDWETTDKGAMKESQRFVFRHWDFNPRLPRNAFDTRPPRGYRTCAEFDKEMKARRPNGFDREIDR